LFGGSSDAVKEAGDEEQTLGSAAGCCGQVGSEEHIMKNGGECPNWQCSLDRLTPLEVPACL